MSKFEHTEVPALSPNMIVRTVVFVVALINSIATMFGFELNLVVDQENLYQIISGVFLVGSGYLAWFKNNDVTKRARARAKTVEEVESSKEKAEKHEL